MSQKDLDGPQPNDSQDSQPDEPGSKPSYRYHYVFSRDADHRFMVIRASGWIRENDVFAEQLLNPGHNIVVPTEVANRILVEQRRIRNAELDREETRRKAVFGPDYDIREELRKISISRIHPLAMAAAMEDKNRRTIILDPKMDPKELP